MEKLAIITDSTSELTDDLLAKHDIYRVPLKVYFGREEYWDRETITPQQFFTKIKDAPIYPRTSQTTSKHFFELFQKLSDKGYTHILCILISSQISKTVETAQFASNMISSVEIKIIDSHVTSYGLAFLSIYARELANQGKTMNEIAELVIARIPKTLLIFSVDNLSALERGGRIGKIGAFFGNMMGVRPILAFYEGHGKIEVVEKVNSTTAANEAMVKLAKDHADKYGIVQGVSIMHGVLEQNCQALKQTLLGKGFTISQIVDREIGSIIGTHLGDKGWGMVVC